VAYDKADDANAMLISALQHPAGSVQRAEDLKAADVYAQLALRDAILEWVSVLKQVAGERAERNGAG
jgi:hypothetical protein